MVWQNEFPPSVGIEHRPLRHPLLLEQELQTSCGGLQLQLPSLAHTPVVQAPASSAQPVIWQTPASVLHSPLRQSAFPWQELQTIEGEQLQLSSVAHNPPAAAQAGPASSRQLVVWQRDVLGSHRPSRHSLFCAQKPQRGLGGWQVHEPFPAHAPPKPAQSEPASTAHRVVSQTPASASQRPLRHCVSFEQEMQSGWGGKQLQEPSELQSPVGQAPASAPQSVISQTPASVLHSPLRQSPFPWQEPQTDEGEQLQLSLAAHNPPAAPHAEPASSRQLVV